MTLLRDYIRETLIQERVLAIGQCYPFAYEKAKEWWSRHIDRSKPPGKGVHPDIDNKEKFKVVHGRVTNKWNGESALHAWVEMGDMIFDDQTKFTKPDGIPRDVYYDMYQPEPHNEYTAEDAVSSCMKKGHPGPWDDESLESMRQRDAWLDEGLFRQYAKELLQEGVEFRTLDSPLKYGRTSAAVKRIALCDTSVTEPNPSRDAYFNEYQEMERYGAAGRRLKKPRKGQLVPGVSDACVIGFLDYHQQAKTSDGNDMWYIDYMKTRGDKGGQGTASKLIDEFYNTVAKPGDHVHFGKMMRKEIGHLKDKMVDKYPEVNTIGAVNF